eukprot:10731135-Alexandrium_andersonii.AAC.1
MLAEPRWPPGFLDSLDWQEILSYLPDKRAPPGQGDRVTITNTWSKTDEETKLKHLASRLAGQGYLAPHDEGHLLLER